MFEGLKNGFANVLNVKGRDSRKHFWIWVGVLFGAQLLLTMALMIPMFVRMVDGLVSSVQRIPNTTSAAAAQARIAAPMMQMMEDVRALTPWTNAANIIFWLLIISIVVRRLHDFDWSGWWAAIPLGLQAVLLPFQDDIMNKSIDNMAIQFSDPANAMGGIGMYQSPLVVLATLAGYAVIGMLIFVGVRKPSEGDNRFGPPPVV